MALRPDKYAIARNIFSVNYRAYGYRKMHSILRSRKYSYVRKKVRMIMHEEGLSAAVISRKRYSSYKGEISPEVPKLL